MAVTMPLPFTYRNASTAGRRAGWRRRRPRSSCRPQSLTGSASRSARAISGSAFRRRPEPPAVSPPALPPASWSCCP